MIVSQAGDSIRKFFAKVLECSTFKEPDHYRSSAAGLKNAGACPTIDYTPERCSRPWLMALAFRPLGGQYRSVAGSRKPGPICSYTDRPNVADGTTCTALSFAPVPTGISALSCSYERRDLDAVYDRAVQLIPASLSAETGCSFDSRTLQALVSGLSQSLKAVTPANIDKTGILRPLGLEFLTDSIYGNLSDVVCRVRLGLSMGDDDRAAETLASAAGLLGRLMLQGMVAFTASSATRQGPDIGLVQLDGLLRSSKLGEGFAKWVEKNWKDLLSNPRLKAGSSSAGVTDQIVFQPRPRTAYASKPQATQDPPTFLDIDAMAQAATLIAAAAQGVPFCPL